MRSDRIIYTPVEESLENLKLGDALYITGRVFTARDRAHKRMVKYLRNNQQLPFNVEDDVLYHCGPIVKKVNGRWNVLSAGPTTSSRFESYVPELLTKLSFRVILGKGGFSAEVMRDLSRREVTYCAITGGTGVLWAKKIKRVARVHWLDLGTAEAVWEFEVEKLGPVFVALESSGNSIYENVRKTSERNTE